MTRRALWLLREERLEAPRLLAFYHSLNLLVALMGGDAGPAAAAAEGFCGLLEEGVVFGLPCLFVRKGSGVPGGGKRVDVEKSRWLLKTLCSFLRESARACATEDASQNVERGQEVCHRYACVCKELGIWADFGERGLEPALFETETQTGFVERLLL